MQSIHRTDKNDRVHFFVTPMPLILLLLSALVFSACEFPQGFNPRSGGSLRVTIDPGGISGRALLPDLDMVPHEYRVRGSGPSGESFEASAAGGTVEFRDLAAGQWLISVSALSAEGVEIGYGEKPAVLEQGVSASVTVDVRPFSGTGSLSLTVTWPSDAVPDAEVTGSLAGPGDQILHLEFGTAPGSSVYFNGELDAGYYTLVLQLLDGGEALAGIVEAVRIVKDGHTEGSFSFGDLNLPVGDISITVTVDLEEPLDVEIIGAPEVLQHGTEMTVSSSVGNSKGEELSYRWYLNGSSAAEGETVTLGAGLPRGHYRLDLVVFTAGRKRSGSAAHIFRVE